MVSEEVGLNLEEVGKEFWVKRRQSKFLKKKQLSLMAGQTSERSKNAIAQIKAELQSKPQSMIERSWKSV